MTPIALIVISVLLIVLGIFCGYLMHRCMESKEDRFAGLVASALSAVFLVVVGIIGICYGNSAVGLEKDVLNEYVFTYIDKNSGEEKTLHLYISTTSTSNTGDSYKIIYETSFLWDNDEDIVAVEVYPDDSCIITHKADGKAAETYGTDCKVEKTGETKTGLPADWLKKWLAKTAC